MHLVDMKQIRQMHNLRLNLPTDYVVVVVTAIMHDSWAVDLVALEHQFFCAIVCTLSLCQALGDSSG